jgi:DNA polymerase-3 subunit epsilon
VWLWLSRPWEAVTYWALDLETGGLDPRSDAVLAVGMVPIVDGVVRLADKYETLVRSEGLITPESISAHQLRPRDVDEAPPLSAVLDEVDRRIAGNVLLVHNARVDVKFLRSAHHRVRRWWPGPDMVDTVDLLVKLAKKTRFLNPDAAGGERMPELNLTAARRELGLPEYQAHDALTDAIATAELFLVLRRKLGARTIRQLLS